MAESLDLHDVGVTAVDIKELLPLIPEACPLDELMDSVCASWNDEIVTPSDLTGNPEETEVSDDEIDRLIEEIGNRRSG